MTTTVGTTTYTPNKAVGFTTPRVSSGVVAGSTAGHLEPPPPRKMLKPILVQTLEKKAAPVAPVSLKAYVRKEAERNLRPITEDVEDMYDRVKKRVRSQGPVAAIRGYLDKLGDKVDAQFDQAPTWEKILESPFATAVDVARDVVDSILPEQSGRAGPRPILKNYKRKADAKDEVLDKIEPLVKDAAAMVIEPNPGPGGTRRSRKGSSKSRRGSSRKRTPSRRRSASQKSSRKRGPRKGRSQSMKGRSGRDTRTKRTLIFEREDLVYQGTLTPVSPSVPQPAGTVVYSVGINPKGGGSLTSTSNASIPALALNYEAAKWENFDCKVEFKIRKVGSGYVGGLGMAGIEMDVTDAMPSGVEGLQRLKVQGGKSFAWSEGASIGYSPLNRERFVKSYFVDSNGSDPRMWTKGKFWLLQEEPPTTWISSSQTYVPIPITIHLKYSFRFSNATLEPNVSPLNSSGLLQAQSNKTANQSATNPIALGQMGAWNNTAVIATCLADTIGVVVYSDSGADHVMFPTGTMFDNVSTVLMSASYNASTATALVVAAEGGATAGAVHSLTSAAVGANNIFTVQLAQTATSPVFPSPVGSIYQLTAKNTWTAIPNLPPLTWGGVRINAGGASGFSQSSISMTILQTYFLSLLDRQILCSGPATLEHKALQSWKWDSPLSDHVREFAAREMKYGRGVAYLERKSEDAEAELEALRETIKRQLRREDGPSRLLYPSEDDEDYERRPRAKPVKEAKREVSSETDQKSRKN